MHPAHAQHMHKLTHACSGTLGKLVVVFQVPPYRFQCRIWLEYVDSKSNWSDGISRDYGADGFARANRFDTCLMSVDLTWIRSDHLEVWSRSRGFERAQT